MTQQQGSKKSKPPGDMLTANLLALLNGWQACGYDLMSRMRDAGMGDYNSGTIYRNLRQMEKLGLISSMWDTSAEGPARRMYNLTTAGSLFLNNWVSLLDTHRRSLEAFMNIAGVGPKPSEDQEFADDSADFVERENS